MCIQSSEFNQVWNEISLILYEAWQWINYCFYTATGNIEKLAYVGEYKV